MQTLKNIRLETIVQQCKRARKYYRSHVWVSEQNKDGYSFLGISQWSKRYFVKMHKLNFERYPRTIYSIPNRDKIKAYLEATREKRLNGRLSPAEIIEDDRFTSKQGEPFLLMETYNVDVELQAPADLYTVEIPSIIRQDQFLLTHPFLCTIALINPEQLRTLKSEEQYNREPKIFSLPNPNNPKWS